MPRKAGSRGRVGRRPRLWRSVRALLEFALRDEDAPEDAPPPGLPELLSRHEAALRFAAEAKGRDTTAQLEEVVRAYDLDLERWLLQLAESLDAAKLVEESLVLRKRMGDVFPG